MELFRFEGITLEEENGFIYLTVEIPHSSLKKFETMLQNYPRVAILQFKALKDALEKAENVRVQIGELKPFITLSISKDLMSAKMKVNCTKQELTDNRETITTQIMETLHKNGVKEGIQINSLNELKPQKEFLIAEGNEPKNGSDAILSYYKPAERRPKIKEDGKANYFEMNFIDEVKKEDWLGEKIPPTKGISGMTVTGELVLPKNGKDKKLLYDRKTVGEFNENGIIVLRALIDGVVTFNGGRISVGNHLTIDGDVGVETGNIKFDGSITINGIVQEGYSVHASKDISILGEMGISGVKEIISYGGDIFIKGGVFGKGKTLIKANKHVYLKHANDCKVEALGDIHIGFYSLGSILKGRNIIADTMSGKLIGGTIEAKGKVVAAIIGNKMERKTFINVEGFSRFKVQEELENTLIEYKKGIIRIESLRRQLEIYEGNMQELNDYQKKQHREIAKNLDQELIKVQTLDNQRKTLMSLLETKGEGQISIEEIAYPDTMVKIKNIQKKLNSKVKGTFYSEDNSMHFE
ncbi:DUF342 domain-containing protein [Cytobacillus sp. Hz8]|uniref:DUF342 domain-containing protein n=1 Tax=Cytobacillus sp. Hz8 TaxID=3347168 RepID=UPI0035D79DE8